MSCKLVNNDNVEENRIPFFRRPSVVSRKILPSFPRYFKIGRHWVNSYKVFLCIGVYVGTIVSAAVAQSSGISPLRTGVGCISCAIVGMFGARVFFLITNASRFANERFWSGVWNSRRGGWSVFGGLIIVPFSFALSNWLHIPLAVYWDHMIWGIVSGALFIRFGCICNGCCCGKATTRWYGVRQHDTCGTYQRRIPVQWLEIGWWLLALAGLIVLWPLALPSGTYAAAGLGWYGVGRFWLEPLREQSDTVVGVRIHQAVAALLAIVAGGVMLRLL